MRATGFFFAIDDGTYLVTARHNILPTEVEYTNPDGEVSQLYSTDLTLPEVHIYLQSGENWIPFEIDVREADDVRQTPDIDIIGIRIDFSPEKYGYQVWNEDDISDSFSGPAELEVTGFNSESFSNIGDSYDMEICMKYIDSPYTLSANNPLPDLDVSSNLGLELIAIYEGPECEYQGLSGSPVIGDGLVGIHVADIGIGQLTEDQNSAELHRLVYIRAAVLPKLLKS